MLAKQYNRSLLLYENKIYVSYHALIEWLHGETSMAEAICILYIRLSAFEMLR